MIGSNWLWYQHAKIIIDDLLVIVAEDLLEWSADICNGMEVSFLTIDWDNGGFILGEYTFHFEEFSWNVLVDLFLVKLLFENTMKVKYL